MTTKYPPNIDHFSRQKSGQNQILTLLKYIRKYGAKVVNQEGDQISSFSRKSTSSALKGAATRPRGHFQRSCQSHGDRLASVSRPLVGIWPLLHPVAPLRLRPLFFPHPSSSAALLSPLLLERIEPFVFHALHRFLVVALVSTPDRDEVSVPHSSFDYRLHQARSSSNHTRNQRLRGRPPSNQRIHNDIPRCIPNK